MDFTGQLVVFAVLMESGEGILDKSPAQIFEAWRAIVSHPSEPAVLSMMGDELAQKYQAWVDKWRKEQPAKESL